MTEQLIVLKKGILRPDIIQNTPSWLAWRKLGGSDAAILMGISPWCDVMELWQRKLGLVPDITVNAAMQRGHDLEPEARVLLEIEMGISFPPACYEDAEFPFITASVDGDAVLTHRAISEIKAPGIKTHMMALGTEGKPPKVPDYYVCQCQHNMGVTGAEVCHYFSYAGELVDHNIIKPTARIEIIRDEDYIQRIQERERKFQECLDNQTEPDPEYFSVKDAGLLNGTSRSDPAWSLAVKELLGAKEFLETALPAFQEDARLQYDARIQRINQLMSRKRQMLVIHDGVRIERLEKNGKWETIVTSE
jgi:putative phage-type endonuclease